MKNLAFEALGRAFKFAYKPKPTKVEEPQPVAHKPGDIVQMQCGTKYCVEANGAWTRIK